MDEKTDELPLEDRPPEPLLDDEPVLPPQEVRAILEALIFASPQPLTPHEIAKVLDNVAKV